MLTDFRRCHDRTTGLLQSGSLKEVPIWYDVYKKYPPELEPNVERPLPPQDPIPEIVYEEDFERARNSGAKYKTGRKTKTRDRQMSSFIKSITEKGEQ